MNPRISHTATSPPKLPRRASHVDGSTVQTVLEHEGLSQWELGRRLGVNQSQVGRWIRGDSKIKPLVQHILSCRNCYRHYVQEAALLSRH